MCKDTETWNSTVFLLKCGSLTFLNFGVAGCKCRGKWQEMRWAKLARRSPWSFFQNHCIQKSICVDWGVNNVLFLKAYDFILKMSQANKLLDWVSRTQITYFVENTIFEIALHYVTSQCLQIVKLNSQSAYVVQWGPSELAVAQWYLSEPGGLRSSPDLYFQEETWGLWRTLNDNFDGTQLIKLV